MKKEKKNRKASPYWKEIFSLCTKAGAFGIVNLFNQPRLEINMDEEVKAINNNHSSLPLNRDDGSESLKKVPTFT